MIIWPSGRPLICPSERPKRDEELKPEIEPVFEENLSVYGIRKMWHQMHREGFDIARCTIAHCTIARLMKDIGIEGVVRGKSQRQRSQTRHCHVRWTR